ncbi:MAG TPA: hypothetical protein VJN67_22355 [Stellaceae bacterium]|nr:hypothetical protein [Stellaceae bacterium]
MEQPKTHRLVKTPQISARFLADWMAASERKRRTIVRNCKYQPIGRVVQHNDAKLIVAKSIRDGNPDPVKLTAEAVSIRSKLADSDFDHDVNDHNADYIERFAKTCGNLHLPEADILAPGKAVALSVDGVRVTVELHFRLRRLTKTNKVRVGAGALRYTKGQALSVEVAEWHTAFLFGYLGEVGVEDGALPEHQLCLVVDAFAGAHHSAPTNAMSRFHNMKAACASISEQWPNIPPPPNAVL